MDTSKLSPGDVLELDPKLILGDRNTRFNLKATRLETLKADIVDKGGVMQAIEVDLLPEPVDGAQFRVTSGHYRLQAVKELNENGAGMKIPATFVPVDNELTRLKRQIAENLERENQSPMDRAKKHRAFIR